MRRERRRFELVWIELVRFEQVPVGAFLSSLIWFCSVRFGWVRFGRFGSVRSGSVRSVRFGLVWIGSVQSGLVRYRSDSVRFGSVRYRSVRMIGIFKKILRVQLSRLVLPCPAFCPLLPPPSHPRQDRRHVRITNGERAVHRGGHPQHLQRKGLCQHPLGLRRLEEGDY